jgi:hypothetical protein
MMQSFVAYFEVERFLQALFSLGTLRLGCQFNVFVQGLFRVGHGSTMRHSRHLRSSGHGRRMLFVDGGVVSSEILAIATSTCQSLDYRWCDGGDKAGGCAGS